MFQSLVRGMTSEIAGQGPLNNALLEAFAIHVRALIHFFFDGGGQDDDVLAVHFFESPDEWTNVAPPLTSALNQAKKRADKEIAHLTYSRQKVTSDKKPWHLIPIFNDLQAAIDSFVRATPDDLLGERWHQTKQQSQTQVKNA
jgi:hypothetical protein